MLLSVGLILMAFSAKWFGYDAVAAVLFGLGGYYAGLHDGLQKSKHS